MPQLKVSDEDLRKVVMALRYPSVEVRAAACFRLEAIADPRTVDVLIGVLRNPAEDAQVRNAAASALETIGGPVVVNKLIEVTREAKATDWLPVFSLAALGETAFEPLLAVLSNPQAKGRAHAATALGLIGDPATQGDVLKALQDKRLWMGDLDMWSQRFALGVLECPFFTDKAAIPFLKELLKLKDWDNPALAAMQPQTRAQHALMISNAAADILAIVILNAILGVVQENVAAATLAETNAR